METAGRPRPHQEPPIAMSKLTIEEKIGSGSFATVYRAHHVDWGCYVAFKKLKLDFSDSTSLQEPTYDTLNPFFQIKHFFVAICS